MNKKYVTFRDRYNEKYYEAQKELERTLKDIERERRQLNIQIVDRYIRKLNDKNKIVTKIIYSDQKFDGCWDYFFMLEMLIPNLSKKELQKIKDDAYKYFNVHLTPSYECESPFFIHIRTKDNFCYDDGYTSLIEY